MSIKLERGANISITKTIPKIIRFVIGLNWIANRQNLKSLEIDGSCFLLGSDNKVSSNTGFIFYNQSEGDNQSVCLLENYAQMNLEGDSSWFTVDLTKIPPKVYRVVFCLTIHDAEEKQQNFSALEWNGLHLVAQETLEEIAYIRYEQELDKETAILVGEFYRYGEEWKFKSIGQGYVNGLGALAESFGVQFDKEAEIQQDAVKTNSDLMVKKKRRASADIISEQINIIKSKIKILVPQITSSAANAVNESSTRLVLDRIFQDALGYSFDEIKTEQKIQGRAADYVLSPDGQDVIVIEAKRAGTPLRQKQIFQATSYAAYSGIQWAILTNLTEWQFYKVSTIDKVDPHLVFTIDLRNGLDDENAYNLMLISKFGMLRKGLLEKVWIKKVCLRTETLIAAILNDEVIGKIRTIITKEMGGQITNDEVKRAIELDILKI